MAKIMFAHPLFLADSPEERASASPYFPLGILYLAAFVREAGHEVTVFDGTFADGHQSFVAALDRERPDAVGLSAVLPTREATMALAGLAAARGLPVIVGGPDPTADPARYLADPAIDLVVHHEGEQTIVALLDRIDDSTLMTEDLDHEPGIAFRRAGSVVVNQPRPPVENLDDLPLPARDLIDVDRYLDQWDQTSGYRSLTVTTSRGCPYRCSWCVDSVHGQSFRQRSPENVAAEVKTLQETYDIGRLRVVDDVDGIERSWLEQWAEVATTLDAAVPFEALNDLERQDIPLLDVRDSL